MRRWWAARIVTMGLVLAGAAAAGGCQAMSSVDAAAEDFSSLAKSATELAEASTQTIEEAKVAMGGFAEYAKQAGDSLGTVVPALAEDTRRLVTTFQTSTREMGAATKQALEQTSATMQAITPEIQTTLTKLGDTAVRYGEAVEKIGTELTTTGRSLGQLVDTIKSNNETNRAWLRASQTQLDASMKAAERTLDQTAKSLANTEEGIVETLQTSQKTLDSINRILRLEADDEEEVRSIQNLAKRLDTAVVTFLWVFLGGGILLVVIATVFIYDKLTARARLRRQLEAMGFSLPDSPGLDT